TTIRAWIVDHGEPVDVTVVGPTTLDAFIVPWSTILGVARVDTFALSGLAVALVLGIVEVTAIPAPFEGAERQALVALGGVVLTGLLLFSADSVSVTTLWFALPLVGAAAIVATQTVGPDRATDGPPVTASPTFVDLRGWLTVALIAAPVLWLADSVLVSTNGGPSLFGSHPVPLGFLVALILVGAATAGLAPFDSWRARIVSHLEAALVADGLAPVVGFALAARAMGTAGARVDRLPLVLLVLIGLAGLTRLSRSDLRRVGFSTFSKIDRSIAFFLLVLPFPIATEAGLFVVGLGALGRAFQRVPAREQSRWLRPTVWIFPNPPPEAGRQLFETSSRPPRPTLDRWAPDQIRRLANQVADAFFVVEDRYNIAVGVLVALAVLFAFAE
ncbi:MAG TPA: hypothetical protein VKT80_17385, partial [Chloroflexota bacterium]|nr:hypothetical protein [Chloroflexota bacterium]